MTVECQVSRYFGIIDQGVADFDIRTEGTEFSSFLCRAQPQAETGDLHGFFIDIHAEDVVFEDVVFHVGQDEGRVEELGFEFVHVAMLGDEEFQDLIEESSRSTGRIADGELQEPVAVGVELLLEFGLSLSLRFLGFVVQVFGKFCALKAIKKLMNLLKRSKNTQLLP